MHEHGTFCWNELNTRDPKKACDFYARTLGWTFDSMPMPDGTYRVAKSGDKMAGGIFEMKGSQFEGIPSHWLSYVEVDDVDARVEAAKKAGATIKRAPWDIPGVGRIAIVQDPTGAIVGWMKSAETA